MHRNPINPERVESIPHIPSIKFNFAAAQQSPQLLFLAFQSQRDCIIHPKVATNQLPCELNETPPDQSSLNPFTANGIKSLSPESRRGLFRAYQSQRD